MSTQFNSFAEQAKKIGEIYAAKVDPGIGRTRLGQRLPAKTHFAGRKSKGIANMEDHETRRKIIREWMALPKDKRQTEEQVAAFAKKAAQQNEFHRSRRDPSQKFRRDPYQKLMGWLLPRAGKS